jgi:hypothetical protein
MKRIKYGKEPYLNVHRYVVAVSCRKKSEWNTQYFFCWNLEEVKAQRDKARAGSVIEVYSATHNFREAWEK